MLNLRISIDGSRTGKGFAGSAKQQANFGDLDRIVALPVSDGTVQLARRMQRRIFSGITATGGRTAPRGTYTSPDMHFWVGPHRGVRRPAHAGKVVIEGGPWRGWAVYPNYQAYLSALGESGRPRNYVQTGQLKSSMQVVVDSPLKNRITFRGSKKTVAYSKSGDKAINKHVSRIKRSEQAYRASARERMAMMAPSADDMDYMVQWAGGFVVDAWAKKGVNPDDVGVIAAGHDVRRQGLKLSGKATRYKQRISKITGN